MVRTLRRRLADGRTRKLIVTIFAGKMLGVIAVLFVVNQIVGLIDTPASAQTVTHQASDLVNPVNTVWVLVTAFLVFFMKVSDTPFAAVEPYLALEGLDVFIGNEPLVLEGITRGAVGAVSGLASAFPAITAALVHDRSERANEQVGQLRSGLQGIPFHAALKEVLVARDVLTSADVRAPLRGLTDDERAKVLALAAEMDPQR